MISIRMKAREKGFRMNLSNFSALVTEIFKVEIEEIVTKSFKKRSRGPSQRT